MKNEKAKHTPGPWRIQSEYDGTIPIDGWSERAEEWVEICRVSLDMLDTKERAANAALISACPDLLAALEGLMRLGLQEDYAVVIAARAAIARATGKRKGDAVEANS